MFDSPLLALRATTSSGSEAVAFTANSDTYVFSRGGDISRVLPSPLPTGLAADVSNVSYSHCGKWLNAAFVDPANTSIVHGYYHQEWRCDYAHNEYTNKSVGYGVSADGGISFTVDTSSNQQLIASSNTSSAHQTGEGDHGVVRLGDYLYMFFINWDGDTSIHGGTTSGVARSAVADRGRPGTWRKWCNGSWTEPGVGGHSDVVWVPGTAVYALPAIGPATLVAIGVIFSAPLSISYSEADPPVSWTTAAAGPVFNAAWSSWERTPTSGELFGYPGLAAAAGSPDGAIDVGGDAYVYFTYLSPGHGFTERWEVRRPIRFMQQSNASLSAPPALAALSLWVTTAVAPGTPRRWWATTGPVTPDALGNFSLNVSAVAYLVTAPSPPRAAVALIECQLNTSTPGGGSGIVALALDDGECGLQGGALERGVPLRTPGWLAASAADANALGWASVQRAGIGGGYLSLRAAALWRCAGIGVYNFTVATGDDAAAVCGAGFAASRQLGFALVQ